MIDFYAAIMALSPKDWNGAIIGANDAHPTAGDAAAEPTDENFRKSGYLLRGWLTVKKIEEVKKNVIDAKGAPGAEKTATTSKPAAK